MKRPPADRALRLRLLAYAAVVCALLVANNLLPYVGMRDDSCQTMFSGLDWSASTNNHLFMPQHAMSTLWAYYEDVVVEIDPPPPAEGRVADLAAWLGQPNRLYNDEALRVVITQICDAGHAVRIERRLRHAPRVERVEHACGDGRFAPRAYIPVRLYETDFTGATP